MSQRIIFAEGCFEQIESIIAGLRAKSPLVITGGESFEKSGAKKKINIHLKKYTPAFFSVSTPLPEFDEVQRGISFLKKNNFDLIIAIGGGSVLDTAKLIRFLGAQQTSLTESLQNINSEKIKGIPLIAVTTTAGSGAEATHFAVLYIKKVKQSIAHLNILPDVALIDPLLSFSAPSSIAAASGLDALSQSIESYWSIGATSKSKLLAGQSISLASKNLVSAVVNKDRTAHAALSKAASMAGQAINISKTTAPHAVSYTLTTAFGIPHGIAVALTLGEFFRCIGEISDKDINHPLGRQYIQKTTAEICSYLGVTTPDMAKRYYLNLLKDLGVSASLSEYGIKQTDFPAIIDSVNYERLSNHPQKITKEELLAILFSIK
jgi:alcohol dehydrogenase